VLLGEPAAALQNDTEGGESAAITVLDQVVPVAEDPAEDNNTDAAPRSVDPPADAINPEQAEGPPTADDETVFMSERELLGIEFNRFRQFKNDGMLDEAENSAKRAVEMSIGISGPTSNDTAKALSNLATVQHDKGEFALAEQNFQSAIEIFKDNEDQLSARLLNPLQGLGAAQLESGKPELAAQTFRQATHISHVNEGPHNLDQIPILEALAETNLRMGEIEAAKNAQDTIYALNLRHLNDNTLAMIPPLMRRAAWQRRTGYVLDERATYRRIVRIIEDSKGKDDISLITPLTKLAESYFHVDTTEPSTFQSATIATGEVYFKRAVRIAEESPESNWQILAGTQVALGDYYNFRSDQGRARRTYRDAWDLLSADEERAAWRDEALGRLLPLNANPIATFVGDATRNDVVTNKPAIRSGSLIAAYDVNTRGRVTKVEFIESIPPEFIDMQDKVLRELRNRIFRPPFVDGEPVESPNQILTHTYYYEQDELDKLRSAAAPSE
jgi:tetratricopeptide (TPR) repeat protein